LGVDYVFTSSVADCDLNYSPESGGTFRIVPQGLLAEHDIRDNIRIQFSAWEKTVCFFSTTGDIPFDIFSAAFYLVSRYDEYLSYESDAHHRFPAESCVTIPKFFHTLTIVAPLEISFFSWAIVFSI